MAFQITGIMLAAGLGSRFDPSGRRYKLTQPLPDKRSVIAASYAAMARHVDRLLLVVGDRRDELVRALAHFPDAPKYVVCPDAGSGMGASLKAGVRGSASTDAWLIGLADMPWIQASTIQAVCAELHRGERIVRPYHRGQPGHPVGISASLRAELLGLPDTAGAAALIRRHAADAVRIDVDDLGSVMDVDYPADLLSL